MSKLSGLKWALPTAAVLGLSLMAVVYAQGGSEQSGTSIGQAGSEQSGTSSGQTEMSSSALTEGMSVTVEGRNVGVQWLVEMRQGRQDAMNGAGMSGTSWREGSRSLRVIGVAGGAGGGGAGGAGGGAGSAGSAGTGGTAGTGGGTMGIGNGDSAGTGGGTMGPGGTNGSATDGARDGIGRETDRSLGDGSRLNGGTEDRVNGRDGGTDALDDEGMSRDQGTSRSRARDDLRNGGTDTGQGRDRDSFRSRDDVFRDQDRIIDDDLDARERLIADPGTGSMQQGYGMDQGTQGRQGLAGRILGQSRNVLRVSRILDESGKEIVGASGLVLFYLETDKSRPLLTGHHGDWITVQGKIFPKERILDVTSFKPMPGRQAMMRVTLEGKNINLCKTLKDQGATGNCDRYPQAALQVTRVISGGPQDARMREGGATPGQDMTGWVLHYARNAQGQQLASQQHLDQQVQVSGMLFPDQRLIIVHNVRPIGAQQQQEQPSPQQQPQQPGGATGQTDESSSGTLERVQAGDASSGTTDGGTSGTGTDQGTMNGGTSGMDQGTTNGAKDEGTGTDGTSGVNGATDDETTNGTMKGGTTDGATNGATDQSGTNGANGANGGTTGDSSSGAGQ